MGKIFYMMGKSSSGKDTVYKEIRKELTELKTLTLYTTRPMREGEKDGVEYYFVSNEILEQYGEEGKIIELRTYQTVYGDWKYATIDDGQIHLSGSDYLMIGTLESYMKMKAYYGQENLVPLYIEVEDGERLMRAIARDGSRSIRDTKKSAEDFWQIRKISRKRILRQQELREDIRMTTKYDAKKR